jgi:hypothetical protein
MRSKRRQTAVTAFQPILPELAEHWHGSTPDITLP